MKKVLAIAAMISMISLGCAGDLFGQFVRVTIENLSGMDIRVKGDNGGDITIDSEHSHPCNFGIIDFKTTLTISSLSESMRLNETVEITGDTPQHLTINPDLKYELRDAGAGKKKKRRIQQNPNRRRRTHLD